MLPRQASVYLIEMLEQNKTIIVKRKKKYLSFLLYFQIAILMCICI